MSLLDSDDSASNSMAGIARLQAVTRASLSIVIRPAVHYEGSPDDAVFSMQRDKTVSDIDGGNTSRVSCDVAQISDMALRVTGATVLLL